MAHIVVKTEQGNRVFSSHKVILNDKGVFEKIDESEEDELQGCYQALIDNVRRKEFEKNLVSIIKNYDSRLLQGWQNIEIKITSSINEGCEMNIYNE